MGGACLLKAPTYKIVEENSNFANSFFYSLDQDNRKSLFYPMCTLGNLGDTEQPLWGNVGEFIGVLNKFLISNCQGNKFVDLLILNFFFKSCDFPPIY